MSQNLRLYVANVLLDIQDLINQLSFFNFPVLSYHFSCSKSIYCLFCCHYGSE